jgi:DNA-binding CsgD family transcriptional regulator
MDSSHVLHVEDVYQIIVGLSLAAQRPTARHRLAEALVAAARLASADRAACLAVDHSAGSPRLWRYRDGWTVSNSAGDHPKPANHAAISAIDLVSDPLLATAVADAERVPTELVLSEPQALRQADDAWRESPLRRALGLDATDRRLIQAAWFGKGWAHPMIVLLTTTQDEPSEAATERLTQTLRVYFRGITPIVQAASRQPSMGKDVLHGLTPRLRQLLALLLQGLSGKDAAGKMRLTIDSTQTYTKRLYRRMGVRSRNELVSLCQQLGIRPEGLATPPADDEDDDTGGAGSGGLRVNAP